MTQPLQAISDNDYALITNPSGAMDLCSLDGATSQTLPPGKPGFKPSFNPKTCDVAYLTSYSTGTALLLAGPAGILAQHPVDPSEEFAYLAISPDSRKVFFLKRGNKPYAVALGQYGIWDTNSNSVTRLESGNLVETLLAFTNSIGITPIWTPYQWAPDGQSILWTTLAYSGNPQNAYVTKLNQASF